MQEQENGKELVLTSPETLAPKRSKPSLVQVGNRIVSSDFRFHAPLAAEWLADHSRKQWAPVVELSKMFGGGNTIDGKRRIRKNMFRVFTILLNRGEFLVYETEPNGRIKAVKLLDITSEQERQAALPQLERMKQRHQLTTEKYEKALSVIELHRQL